MAKHLRAANTTAQNLITALGSPRIFVALLTTLSVAAATGTFLQASHGEEYAQWCIYRSTWFTGLLIALAANIACAALRRLPWRRSDAGTLAAQIGLLAILIGSLFTRLHGVEGEIALLEGASTEQLTLSQQSQITASWVDRPREPPYVFTFESGPNDWPHGTELNLGQVDGLSTRVLNFLRDPQPLEQLVVDPQGRGGPLIRFEVKGLHSASSIRGGMHANEPLKGSLADVDYGAEVLVGPVAVRLQRAASDAMLAEFLHPQDESLGDKGVLTAYYKESVEHVNVGDQVGKVVKVGRSGAAVELVQYLANAKLDANGKFQSIGTDVRNPLVELKVTLPGDEKPYRQVAFAKSPMLNFDGVYGRDCPVKFTYQHPQLKPGSALEFMQARDGKLYARTSADNNCAPIGEIKVGTTAKLKDGLEFTVNDYLPHARRDILFQQATSTGSSEHPPGSPAAQLEVSVGGQKQTLWLQRGQVPYDVGIIEMPEGQLRVRFTKAHLPLGFCLELVNVERPSEHVGNNDKAPCGVMRIVDKQHSSENKFSLSSGQTASHNGFRIYPSHVRDSGHGKQMVTMRVVYDPGRIWKIAGSWLMCLGICGFARTTLAQTHVICSRKATLETAHVPVSRPPIRRSA